MVIKIFSSIYDCEKIEMNIFHWHIIILKMLQPTKIKSKRNELLNRIQ